MMKRYISFPLFFKLFTAFVLIMVIPVLIISITYYYHTLSFFTEELFKTGTEKLNMVQGFVEASLNEVLNDAKQIALSDAIENLSRMPFKSSDYGKNISVISGVLNLLYNARISNKNIHSVYLYDYNNEIIYTSDMIYFNRSDFYDTAWIDEYKNKERNILFWMETREAGIPVTNENSAKSGLTGTFKVITMVYPVTYTSSFRGLLVINLKEDELTKVLNHGVLQPTGEITVISPSGNVILSTVKGLATTNISDRDYISEIISSGKVSGFVRTKAGKENYIVVYNKSDYNGWIYLNICSIQQFLTNFRVFRSIILIVSFIMTVAGIPVCYFVSRSLYNPVRNIVEKLRLQIGITGEKSNNEMDVISNALNEILKQGNQLRRLYEHNAGKLRENSLLAFIKGKTDPDTMQHLPFDEEYFSCVIITIDNFNSFNRRFPGDEGYYTKELILKLSLEIMNSYKCAGIQYEKNAIVIIANLSAKSVPSFKSGIVSLIDEIKTKAYKVYDGTFTVTVSNCHKGPENAETAFEEAKNLIKYRLIYGSDKIIVAWEINDKHNDTYYYPYSAEKHVFNFLKLGNTDELLKAVDNFFLEIRKKNLSYDNILQIINQLISGIVKYMLSERLKPAEVFSTDKTLYEHLASLETLDEIQQWIKNIFVSIIEYRTIRKSDKNKYVRMVQEYIHEHYNENISPENIAEIIGVSYSYLRRLYNEELNMSITDYLNTYRIEKAKNMLKNSNLNLEKIALSVGYNNIQSFKRYFKKYEGITPSEYRKIYS
ncbi:AraC family transcriptional regulator [Thermoclostridium stercorarium]|jgi:AraC-like DNA-binding protein|nr:AraC family transcriptional regulator [Thermoclostridium stercorarium]